MLLGLFTRRALYHLGNGLRCVSMFAGLGACTVYDDAALARKASSTSAQGRELDAASATMSRVRTAVGCEAEQCVMSSTESQDSGISHASDAGPGERDASRDAAPDQPAPDEEPAASAETAPETKDAATPANDSGPIDAGRDAAAPDAEGESGFCSACDSRPASPPVLNDSGGTGNVTTYGSVTSPTPSTSGACNYGATDIRYYAAINASAQAGDANGQWQGGKICGQCAAVRVKTPDGWKETVVRIVDKCADPNCGIALSGAAALDLMGDRPGRYDGDWRFVSCAGHPEASDGAPNLHVKEGSSTWWALVHVRNPAHAVSAIDWQSSDGASSGSFSYATEAENFYSVPEAVHSSGMVRLTIHYRDNSQVEVALAASQLAQPDSEIDLPP